MEFPGGWNRMMTKPWLMTQELASKVVTHGWTKGYAIAKMLVIPVVTLTPLALATWHITSQTHQLTAQQTALTELEQTLGQLERALLLMRLEESTLTSPVSEDSLGRWQVWQLQMESALAVLDDIPMSLGISSDLQLLHRQVERYRTAVLTTAEETPNQQPRKRQLEQQQQQLQSLIESIDAPDLLIRLHQLQLYEQTFLATYSMGEGLFFLNQIQTFQTSLERSDLPESSQNQLIQQAVLYYTIAEKWVNEAILLDLKKAHNTLLYERIPPSLDRLKTAVQAQRIELGPKLLQQKKNAKVIQLTLFGSALLLLVLALGLEIIKARRFQSRIYQLTKNLESIQQQQQQTEASQDAKANFLAYVSHELRTPLTAILGYTQLIAKEAALTSEQLNHLALISQSGEHLLALINDVLDVARLEADHFPEEAQTFNLSQLLNNLINLMKIKADGKGLALNCCLASDLPQFIHADERKLRQVLLNLLGNAIKFTPHGAVTLTISHGPAFDRPIECPGISGRADRFHLASASDDLIYLQFEIADTGPGIAPEEQVAIFEPFYQTSPSNFQHQGTGLGLAISRKLVQSMRGDLSVRSVPPAGSTFTLVIPVSPQLGPAATSGLNINGQSGCTPAINSDPMTEATHLVETRILHFFNSLPTAWIIKFQAAAIQGNDQRLLELLSGQPAFDSLAKRHLRYLIGGFHFDQIERLTHQILQAKSWETHQSGSNSVI